MTDMAILLCGLTRTEIFVIRLKEYDEINDEIRLFCHRCAPLPYNVAEI